MKIQNMKYSEVVDELQGTIQLLQNHQNTVVACYAGDFLNEDHGFDASTDLNKKIGAIIAQHIDPSIHLDQIKLNDSTEQSECNYNCFQNRYCQAVTITAATSAFLIPLASFVLQQYFSS